MRSPAQTSPLRDESLTVSLNWRLDHLLWVAFVNRNFALLWWGQAISSVGDYAWDTALVLWVASFLASILGIHFGPVDTVFTGLGLLAVIGGLYTRISLRDMIGGASSTSD